MKKILKVLRKKHVKELVRELKQSIEWNKNEYDVEDDGFLIVVELEYKTAKNLLKDLGG